MDLKFDSYQLGELTACYVRDLDTGHIALCLLPEGMEQQYAQRRQWLETPELRSAGISCLAWEVGSLCHVEILEYGQSGGAGYTMKHGPATVDLKFDKQILNEDAQKKVISTFLKSEKGYGVEHILTWHRGEAGIEVQTILNNQTGKPITVEMMTAFSLDGLSPFALEDSPEQLVLHRRYGSWSLEGKPARHTVEQLNLDRTWFNAIPEGERYGSIGSYPVGRWFPFGAIEDTKSNVFWAAQLACEGSWQMELTRPHDGYSFSGGHADREFGGWYRILEDGEQLASPRAFLSTAKGSLSRACQNITDMFHRYADLQPAQEKQLPVMFNDWCAFWGAPTEEKTLRLAEVCAQHHIPYLVIDAGWTKTVHEYLGQGGNGTWELDPKKFPHGLLWLSRRLKQMGIRMGIWMEFEVTTAGSPVFESEYDSMHLQRNGIVLKNSGGRSYWDFRNEKVQRYLYEKVIRFLKDNEIGYLKVDYNGNLGFGCDGAESQGEGLHRHILAVQDFFGKIRQELPDLIIENCAGGGHRLEPAMMQLTALSSYSDAHECPEGPYIAANLQDLILPRQSQVWAVLHAEMTDKEMYYRLSGGFLGRLCISGEIYELKAWQLKILDDAIDFYNLAAPVIKYGFSQLYRDTNENQHHLRGVQTLIRHGSNGEILLVAHSFSLTGPQTLALDISLEEYQVKAAFGNKQMLRKTRVGWEICAENSYDSVAILFQS